MVYWHQHQFAYVGISQHNLVKTFFRLLDLDFSFTSKNNKASKRLTLFSLYILGSAMPNWLQLNSCTWHDCFKHWFSTTRLSSSYHLIKSLPLFHHWISCLTFSEYLTNDILIWNWQLIGFQLVWFIQKFLSHYRCSGGWLVLWCSLQQRQHSFFNLSVTHNLHAATRFSLPAVSR